jgi:hypothetical protein
LDPISEINFLLKKADTYAKGDPMKKMSLFILFYTFWAGTAHSAPQSSLTKVVPSKGIKADKACADSLIETVERALDGLKSKNGRAHVGYFPEMAQQLFESGLTREKAKKKREAFLELRNASDAIEDLAFTVSILDELEKTNMLAFCALSQQCSVAQMPGNHVAYTGRGGKAILIVPTALPENEKEWAASLMGTIAFLSAERFLITWLKSAHTLERLRKGSSDTYYSQYSVNYNGQVPPPGGSLVQGFSLVFLTLYQSIVEQNSYAYFFPNNANLNQEHLGKVHFNILTEGPNSDLTKPICEELGITESNFFDKASQIVRKMTETIKRSVSLN